MAHDDKLPAIQWYPGDWRKDAGVQSLDYFDRGVWWELLQIMHCGPFRGALKWPTGEAMDDEAIAQLLGIDPSKWLLTRTRLLARGIASIEDSSGALVNRRMLKDQHLRTLRADVGRLGGLAKSSKTQAKARSSSSSSSSSSLFPAKSIPPPPEGSVLDVIEQGLARSRASQNGQADAPEGAQIDRGDRAFLERAKEKIALFGSQETRHRMAEFLGYLENNEAMPYKRVEEIVRKLFGLRESLNMNDSVPADKLFCYALDETIKHDSLQPSYVGTVIRNAMVKWREGALKF